MTEREKLVALIQAAVGGCDTYWAGLIADHLLANGVTFATDNFFVTNWTTEKVQRLIHEAPTIDAVPVVRCSECKHMGANKHILFWCYAWDTRVRKDDFCSYGKRRNDG